MNNQNTMTKEFNELRDFILSKGYTCWDTEYQEFDDAEMITQKLQRRVDKVYSTLPVCNCNDKLFVNVDIIQTVYQGNMSITAEVHLCHENKQCKWCNLKIYGLKPEDIYSKLGKHEAKLLKMWKMFCEGDGE